MSYYHRFLQIQAYKHDGSFHRLWSHGLVVRDDEDYIVEVSNRVRVIEANNHVWHTKEKAAFIFSKKEWFNVIVTHQDNGIRFYVNIASPTIVDQGIIKFIDYDLDVKAFPDGYIKELDKNEFNFHAKQYNYSNELQEVLTKVFHRVEEMIKNKVDPFNESTINQYFENFDNFVNQQVERDKQKQR
ncbi:MAG: DUF402 domain-containing protein [Bacilli bacterium]|nr:DUF402 domain-containing protein [Bacilli bacterium]